MNHQPDMSPAADHWAAAGCSRAFVEGAVAVEVGEVYPTAVTVPNSSGLVDGRAAADKTAFLRNWP